MKMKYQKEYPGQASGGNGQIIDTHLGQGNITWNYLVSIVSLEQS